MLFAIPAERMYPLEPVKPHVVWGLCTCCGAMLHVTRESPRSSDGQLLCRPDCRAARPAAA